MFYFLTQRATFKTPLLILHTRAVRCTRTLMRLILFWQIKKNKARDTYVGGTAIRTEPNRTSDTKTVEG